MAPVGEVPVEYLAYQDRCSRPADPLQLGQGKDACLRRALACALFHQGVPFRLHLAEVPLNQRQAVDLPAQLRQQAGWEQAAIAGVQASELLGRPGPTGVEVLDALAEQQGVDSGTRRNGLSKADLDVSAKLPE